ncbi:hypothetical protein PYW07_009290 [Mythimna separata]|uniref:Peptidase S1 domain-containing protein n=1 Tax=Mythimna separata TaxID=271217 RepID=A0AAD8DMG6_MYTSE|nr:hypothetical protein PYW07_009290 [Mythimna separata]
MCFPLYLTVLLCTIAFTKANDVKDEIIENNLTVYDITKRLAALIDIPYDRDNLKELKEKLDKINHYVVDHNVVAAILTNVTAETRLNETNFFEALNENDHFTFLTVNESKSLYLKLKEKMTRDDVMKIVAERGKKKDMVKSARRMMDNSLPKHSNDEEMNDVVDKLLAETPNDQHKVKVKESVYWDPQGELAEMKNYHDNKKSGRRIFKGERTTIQYYPFMASVHVMGRFWCGAAMLFADIAITSASCLQLMHNNRFFRENPKVLQVRIGSNHSRIGGELIDVLEVYFHPGYNPRTLKSNLAVIRLRRHLFMRKKSLIKYLSIDLFGNALPSTAEVLLLGWGVTKMTQRLSYEPIFLQKKVLPVYPNAFCKEVYGDKFISESMFCAGTITTGEGACDHDAGGPAILSGRLVGIISFGPSICGFANAPTVFTKIGFFSDWIETVNESMPANYQSGARTTTTKRSRLGGFMATYKFGHEARETTTLMEPELRYADSIETYEDEVLPLTTTTAATTTTTTEKPARLRIPAGKVKAPAVLGNEDWSIDLS